MTMLKLIIEKRILNLLSMFYLAVLLVIKVIEYHLESTILEEMRQGVGFSPESKLTQKCQFSSICMIRYK